MLTRRQFCQTVTAAAAGALFLSPRSLQVLAAESGALDVIELGPGHWVLTGGGGNVLLLENGGHPVLVDACVAAVASELVDKVTGRVGTEGCTLINTHHHPDHIGGNWLVRRSFRSEVAIIAQQNLPPRVAGTLEQRIRPGLIESAGQGQDAQQRVARAEALTAADFMPTETFDRQWTRQLGPTEIQLHHYGPGHTDNDAVVFLPKANILHAGDLVFNDLHPYVFPEHGASVFSWRESLKQALELCDAETVVIPGHGAVDDRSALIHMDAYFGQVIDIAGAAVKEGRTRDEVAAMELEVFAERGFQRVKHMALVRAYDEISAGR